MSLAAQEALEDTQNREKTYKAFRAAWKEHGGYDSDLPDNWRGSLKSLIAAGLPPEAMAECVAIAFNQAHVYDRNRFKYTCGVAWRKVDGLRKRAEEIVGIQRVPETDPQEEERGEYRAIDLAADLLGEIDPDDRDHLIAYQFKAWRGEGVDHETLIIYAAQAAFSHAITNVDTFVDYLRRVLRARGDYEHLEAAARRYFADSPTDELTILSYTAYLAYQPQGPEAA